MIFSGCTKCGSLARVLSSTLAHGIFQYFKWKIFDIRYIKLKLLKLFIHVKSSLWHIVLKMSIFTHLAICIKCTSTHLAHASSTHLAHASSAHLAQASSAHLATCIKCTYGNMHQVHIWQHASSAHLVTCIKCTFCNMLWAPVYFLVRLGHVMVWLLVTFDKGWLATCSLQDRFNQLSKFQRTYHWHASNEHFSHIFHCRKTNQPPFVVEFQELKQFTPN